MITFDKGINSSVNKLNPSFLKNLSYLTFILINKSPGDPPISLIWP